MYIYKTTNILNGKFYIGQCSKEIEKSTNYLGGGTKLKDCIKKHGKQNFKKEILKICNCITSLNYWEYHYIKMYDSTNPNVGYNILPGSAFDDMLGYVNPATIKEVANKISDKIKGRKQSEEHRKKNSIVRIGKKRTPHSEETIERIRLKNIGKKLTQETKDKISIVKKGQKLSAEVRQKISIKAMGDDNSFYGKQHTEEVKKAHSERMKKLWEDPEYRKKRLK